MIIYPAIDLRGGRCVRLLQGRADQETVYGEDPAKIARTFREAGASWIHVVDLDGAFSGEPRNAEAVDAILGEGLKVQLGGGLRDAATVRRVLGQGVSRAVVGTKAAENPEFVSELTAEFGDRIAVGIDAKNGQVAVRGWVETTATRAVDLAVDVAGRGVRTLIYTDIATDGMLTGPNFAELEKMLAATSASVIASGGVSRREDIVRLVEVGARHANLDGAIVGKAIYEKRVDLGDLLSLTRS